LSERYPTADDLQRYAGVAPVTERSGNSTWVHWRWSCPTFLRQTFVEWAALTIPRSFWAAAFYRKQRSAGKSHQAALRALAYKWIRILHHLLKFMADAHARPLSAVDGAPQGVC
jgi:transposase